MQLVGPGALDRLVDREAMDHLVSLAPLAELVLQAASEVPDLGVTLDLLEPLEVPADQAVPELRVIPAIQVCAFKRF